MKPIFGHLNAIARDASRAAALATAQVERVDVCSPMSPSASADAERRPGHRRRARPRRRRILAGFRAILRLFATAGTPAPARAPTTKTRCSSSGQLSANRRTSGSAPAGCCCRRARPTGRRTWSRSTGDRRPAGRRATPPDRPRCAFPTLTMDSAIVSRLRIVNCHQPRERAPTRFLNAMRVLSGERDGHSTPALTTSWRRFRTLPLTR